MLIGHRNFKLNQSFYFNSSQVNSWNLREKTFDDILIYGSLDIAGLNQTKHYRLNKIQTRVNRQTDTNTYRETLLQ